MNSFLNDLLQNSFIVLYFIFEIPGIFYTSGLLALVSVGKYRLKREATASKEENILD